MEEYTGTSYHCRNCDWIWHYNDICPNCAEDTEIDDVETLYPKDELVITKLKER